MIPSAPNAPRRFSVRRAALLTTALVGLGAATFVFAPDLPHAGYPAAIAQNLTEQAKKVQAPVGFADIVEKVKPAVISVRVKMDGGPQTSGLSSDELPP